jgi:nickel/cobalt exporter
MLLAAGVVAALGLKHALKRFSGFGTFARRAPYASSALIIQFGHYVGYHGIPSLHAAGVVQSHSQSAVTTLT